MRKRCLIFFFVIVLGFIGGGCQKNVSPKDIGDTEEILATEIIPLMITQDYGDKILAQKEIQCQDGLSVLEVLELGFPREIKTAYGGNFVQGIGSLASRSGEKGKPNQDWFYFINGISPNMGVLDYLPQPGEKVWFDYRPWQEWQEINAVIGCYPEPFLHGFGGKAGKTSILYTPEVKEAAKQLMLTLGNENVPEIKTAEITNELIKNSPGMVIVVGLWQDLKEYPYLAGLNQTYKKNGTFIHFDENELRLLDYRGNEMRRISTGGGVIIAFGEMAGTDSVRWLVSGVDQEGLENALNILVERPSEIIGFFGAAVHPDGLIRLPLLP